MMKMLLVAALCFEVDLAFTDGTADFRRFGTERAALAFMAHVGTRGVFVNRNICPEPAPQCLQTRFYAARQIETNVLTRWECDAQARGEQ